MHHNYILHELQAGLSTIRPSVFTPALWCSEPLPWHLCSRFKNNTPLITKKIIFRIILIFFYYRFKVQIMVLETNQIITHVNWPTVCCRSYSHPDLLIETDKYWWVRLLFRFSTLSCYFLSLRDFCCKTHFCLNATLFLAVCRGLQCTLSKSNKVAYRWNAGLSLV